MPTVVATTGGTGSDSLGDAVASLNQSREKKEAMIKALWEKDIPTIDTVPFGKMFRAKLDSYNRLALRVRTDGCAMEHEVSYGHSSRGKIRFIKVGETEYREYRNAIYVK